MIVKRIEQSIQIHASAERVWEVLWDKDTYQTWAAVFTEGSRYTGELRQGGTVRFLDAHDNGMESRIESITEAREITFRHLGEVEAGQEGRTYEEQMYEQYLLEEKEGVTTLKLYSDMPEQYFDSMDAAVTQSLQVVKSLAEA